MYKTVSVKEVYEAIEKNGYPWGKHAFFKNGSYCAIGQAAANLNVYPGSLHDSLNGITDNLAREIENFNDEKAQGYDEVVVASYNILEPYFEHMVELLVRTVHE